MEDHDVTLPPEEISLDDSSIWARLPAIAGVAGIALLAVSFLFGKDITAGDHGHQLPFSYLVGYVYWWTLAMGGMFFVLVHFLSRAGWSVVVRRIAENVMMTIPLFAVLFAPIWIWRHEIYHWMHADAVASDPVLQHKSPYLNETGFLFRPLIYFAAWIAIAYFYRKWSRSQDSDGEFGTTQRMMKFSAPAMILYGLCLSFASYDWVMSLEPHWFSTMFGPYVFAGSAVAIYAFVILVSQRLQNGGMLKSVVNEEHYHDLGKMLFGFVVFWAYLGFSQFMLIWYANIPEETQWFELRWQATGWQYTSIFLAAAHFFLPFFWLITQPAKRSPWRLGVGAVWMMFMHFVDVYWMVMPTLHRTEFHISWLDVTCWLGIGSLFMAAFAFFLKQQSLIPARDPRLAESMALQSV